MLEFNPERLRLARERRGLTKSELAERLGVVLRTLINYEGGGSVPDDSTVRRIAKHLNFPESFFYLTELESPDFESTATFRALTGVAAKYKHQAFAAGTVATEVHEWISRRYNLPILNVPNFPDMDPEDAAISVRQIWGLGIKPIPNMINLLESHGVRVFSLPADHSKEIDAYCIWFKKIPFVFLNIHTSVERSRFDCGHELAHLVLDRLHEKISHQVETRAHKFASAFLIPKDDLVLHKPSLITVQSLMKLKSRYGVSISALAVRCAQLGYLTDWQYRTLMIQLASYRKQEPNPMIARESSAVISKVSESVGGSRNLISKIADDLCLYPAEVSSLMFGLAAVSQSSENPTVPSNRVKPSLRLLK